MNILLTVTMKLKRKKKFEFSMRIINSKLLVNDISHLKDKVAPFNRETALD